MYFVVNPYKPSVPFWDLGKQCRPRSDAADQMHYMHTKRLIKNEIKVKKKTPDILKIGTGLVQLIRIMA